MMSPGVSAKKRHAGAGFTLGCGCKDAKSVSVSASAAGTPSTTATQRRSAGTNPSGSTTTDTLTMTSASSSFLWEHSVVEFDHDDGDCGPESFSGLLRELNELEQSVASWGRKSHHQYHDKKLSQPPPPQPPQEHGKEKNGGNGEATDKPGDCRNDGDGVGVGLDGSVAVVKQSDDPLGDFRQSMLQMIVENGIVAGEDLREMLRRFLTLNAPHHHDVILRAFAEIWDGVFAATASLVHHPPASSRREPAVAPARPPAPRTPPPHRHRHQAPAWRV